MARDAQGNEAASASPPVEVPFAELAPQTLRRLIESVILREGTDYGQRERTLEEKVAEVLERLRRREARIVFDPQTETADIIASAPSTAHHA
ncbi:MAG TPA: YheU family protein [Steroidobacteraceae bacterium]|nr:YheU family protein [Steroidobacteraceae bacterium]